MGILFLLAIIAVVILINMWNGRRRGKMIQRRLKNSYGQKIMKDNGEDDRWPEIAVYDRLVQQNMPEDERVDAITWNDLDMDAVFKQINRTVSFAGEQLLYSELHRLPSDRNHLERREKIVDYFDSHVPERERAQLMLFQLKKEPVHYYIPRFMELLEMQRLPFLNICRLLLATLIVLGGAALLTEHVLAVTAFCMNLAVNIAVYAMGKARYEVYLESLGGMIDIVKAARALIQIEGVEDRDTAESIAQLEKMTRMMGALAGKKQARMTGDGLALAGDYLIGALMWDFIVYDRVVGILEKKQQDFMKLYRFVGEVDMCIAVASYRASAGR